MDRTGWVITHVEQKVKVAFGSDDADIADGHSVYFVEVMTSYVRIDDGLGDVHRMTMLEVRKTFCVDLRGAHFLWCGRG